jgi:hypothetical protein
MSFRNVAFSPNYTASQPRRPYSLNYKLLFFEDVCNAEERTGEQSRNVRRGTFRCEIKCSCNSCNRELFYYIRDHNVTSNQSESISTAT